MFTLRPYQTDSIRNTGNAYRAGHRAPILLAPTGAGKTVLASEIIRSVTAKGWRTLFLAHRKELIDQASSKLHDYEIPHGIIMASRQADRRHSVQVASVATMVNRLDRYDKFDLIVIDECHRSGAPSYKTIVDYYGGPRLLGLTGTPCRLDGKPLGIHGGGMFDTIVPSLTTRELITQGFLSPYRYFQPDTLDMSGARMHGGEYNQSDAAGIVDKPQLVGSVVRHHAEHGVGRPSLIFAASVEHAEHIAAEFRSTGLRATACSADTDDIYRKGALVDLANGQLDVAVNVGLWIEGMDCPAISYIGLARPTKSLTYFRQAVGRGFRLHPGKRDLIIMDHANCRLEHGYPCIHIEWSLDGRPKRDPDEEFAIKPCPRCNGVVEHSTKVCYLFRPDGSECGFVFGDAPVRRREIETVDGRLSEADLSEIVAQEARRAAERRAQEGAARTPEALARIAQERGYEPGWAAHRQEARDEKERLFRQLSDLRLGQGDSIAGIRGMKPKALRQEIAERLQKQAETDEAEIA